MESASIYFEQIFSDLKITLSRRITQVMFSDRFFYKNIYTETILTSMTMMELVCMIIVKTYLSFFHLVS